MRYAYSLGLVLLLFSYSSASERTSNTCAPTHVHIDFHNSCYVELVPFYEITLPIELYCYDAPGDLKQVSFFVENWIGNPGYPLGTSSVNWYADQVIGSLDGAITLIWDEGYEPADSHGDAARFQLGEIEILSFDPDWVAEGHEVYISGPIYEDVDGNIYNNTDWLRGQSRFTFTSNWSGDVTCWNYNWDVWGGDWSVARFFDPPSGATVPDSFDFEFEVESWSCEWGGGFPFTGQVTHDDEILVEFEGDTEENYLFPLHIDGVEPGGSFTITIDIDWYDRSIYEIDYILDEGVPTQSISFSKVKILY